MTEAEEHADKVLELAEKEAGAYRDILQKASKEILVPSLLAKLGQDFRFLRAEMHLLRKAVERLGEKDKS